MHIRPNDIGRPESPRSKPKRAPSPEAADEILLRLQATAGNEAVTRTLQGNSGAVPIQRTIVAGDPTIPSR